MSRGPANSKRRTAGSGYTPEATRRALVDGAIELFGAQTYAATSVQEITEAAGVTKGAFYHHFDSKEDLLALIHDEFADLYLAALEEVIAQYEDPARQLEELLHAFVPMVERYQASVTVFYQERRFLTGDRFKAVKRKRDRFDKLFKKVVEDGIAKGVFREDLDPRIASLGIVGMVAWMYQWFRPSGRYSAHEIADIFAHLVLDGLRA